MIVPHIVSVHIGKVAPLGPAGVPSAFVKRDVPGPVAITALGIEGDEQADHSVHGGPEKAVYAYAAASYADWRAEFPQHTALFVPGGFGENLCIEGLCEQDLCVGDVHQIGGCRLQVCQPRQPCFKLALRFDNKFLPKAMVRSGRSGWYYRVLQPGRLSVGDELQLVERPNPDFSFARLVELVSHGRATRPELIRMQDLPGLASDWQAHARERLTPRS